MNPTYYGLDETNSNSVNMHLSKLVENTFYDLEDSGCVGNT